MQRLSPQLVNWASVLDDGTREQALCTSVLPFIYPHLALMPDAHLGLGATVGSVIPTLGTIIPAAVGVDIGCGMIGVRTQILGAELDRTRLKALRESIERAIPLSAGKANKNLSESAQRRVDQLRELPGADGADKALGRWPLQLGTLGSGNHFIEITLDELDRVWLFLHSGSRGVGNKIAQRHIAIARKECEKWWINLPHRDLAYLVEGTKEFWTYIRELRWAQQYALLNREEMMDRVVSCFQNWSGISVLEQERINCHHNFTQQEQHYGKDVWVSRKGAIEAKLDQPGLIPGSMGTASYVVRGKGCEPALNSAPHGAGRQFSRTSARARFTHDQLRKAMAGIEFRDTAAFLDEIPAAYKDIDQVMEDAKELVEIQHTLRQIVNVKGD